MDKIDNDTFSYWRFRPNRFMKPDTPIDSLIDRPCTARKHIEGVTSRLHNSVYRTLYNDVLSEMRVKLKAIMLNELRQFNHKCDWCRDKGKQLHSFHKPTSTNPQAHECFRLFHQDRDEGIRKLNEFIADTDGSVIHSNFNGAFVGINREQWRDAMNKVISHEYFYPSKLKVYDFIM